MTQPSREEHLPHPPVADLTGEPLDDVDEDELLELYREEPSFDDLILGGSLKAAGPLLWLPGAIRDTHPEAINPWSTTSNPKGVLHTTEGPSWPDYRGWTVNPHLTVMPTAHKGVTVRQHIPFSSGSFALENHAGGVQTNRAYAMQVELVGTCSKGGPGYYWPAADDVVLLDLYRKVIKPLSDAYRIPLRAPQWKPYLGNGSAQDSYGGNNGVRLNFAEWISFTGWLGHQHVPENAHGDPGAFPWPRMIALAKGPIPPASTAPAFPLPDGYYFGPEDGSAYSVSGYRSYAADLKMWQLRMGARGWSIVADGRYGDNTRTVATGFQRQLGLAPDGLIGPATWKAAWTAKVTSS